LWCPRRALHWLTRGILLLACWASSVAGADAQIIGPAGTGQEYLAPSQPMAVFGPPSPPAVYDPVETIAYPGFAGPVSAMGPLGHGFTIRTGVIASSVGGGTFDDHLDRAGWTIEVMVRQPLGCRNQTLWFWEAGGLYLHNPGDKQTVVTSGTIVPDNDDPVFLNNFMETRLKLFQRAGVQIGTGLLLFSDGFHGDNLLTLRGGFRFGHARGRFDQVPTPELQELIDDANDFELFDDVTNSDQYFGLYAALELGIASIPARIPRGEFRVSGGVIYDYTWFDLGDYGRDDSGLATLSPIITFTLLH
jgi:hypothetical protein